MFYDNNSTIIDLSKMLSYEVCYKKIDNAMVKCAVFSQESSSQDLYANIAQLEVRHFGVLENI